jgi:hypothetical protein
MLHVRLSASVQPSRLAGAPPRAPRFQLVLNMTTVKSDDNNDPKSQAPWRGKRRVADAKDKWIGIRCTPADHDKINQAATSAGLSIGAYVRTKTLGEPGPRAVRRPSVATRQLSQLLGHVGKIGSNINQIAHVANSNKATPALGLLATIREDVLQMRRALMRAIRRGH